MSSRLEQLAMPGAESPDSSITTLPSGGNSDQRPSDEAAGATSPAGPQAGLVAAETSPPPPTSLTLHGRHPSAQRFIIRQTAIKCATELVASRQVKIEELFRYAARITAWIYHDGGSKKEDAAA